MTHKHTIPIRGMHCASCELLVERSLKGVAGVTRVKASTKRCQAIMESDRPISEAEIAEAVRDAGYSVGEPESGAWLTDDGNAYGELLLAGIILLGLWALARQTGLLELAMAGGSGADIPSALLIGLTAGISTCMALVGGLVLGVAARHAEVHPETSSVRKFRPHAFFNAGRIAGFTLFGGLLGTAGGFLTPSARMLGILTILVASVMILLGLQLTEISPRLSRLKFTLPPSLSRALGLNRHAERYSHRGALLLGALTFFLPCGFTQAMQLSAVASGSFLSGALMMGAFAIGTAPGLLGIGGLAAVMRGQKAALFFKTAGLAVILLGLFNLGNGYRLTGFASPVGGRQGDLPTQTNVVVENGVQVARMKQTWDGYEPSEFVVRRGIPVRWEIDAENPRQSCAGGVSVPSLGILRNFTEGENLIEFTPERTGEIRFTCTMGMYPGRFIVVD